MERQDRSNGTTKLLFVFYNPSANLELARKRLKPLENRIKNMKIVEPMNERMAIETISKLREPRDRV